MALTRSRFPYALAAAVCCLQCRAPSVEPGAATSSGTAPRAPEVAADAGSPSRAALRAFEPSPSVFLPGGAERAPLLLLLHGLGSSGEALSARFSLAQLSEFRKFVVIAPNGSRDAMGRRFWNAGACCDFGRRQPDDAARLRRLIEYAIGELPVDPARVFVVGFSNGGFMAHRLACESGDLVTAAVSVAGAASGGENCRIAGHVAVLEIHGDADTVVRFGGGRVLDDPRLDAYPSADETLRIWSRRLSCSGSTSEPLLDLEPGLPGQETEVTRAARCERGAVELWRIRGGDHGVAQGPGALDAISRFFADKRKR